MPVLEEKFAFKLIGPYLDLSTAVKESYKLAQLEKEEVYLLFSPGATSFAMFDNEFHRGREFNRIVQELT